LYNLALVCRCALSIHIIISSFYTFIIVYTKKRRIPIVYMGISIFIALPPSPPVILLLATPIPPIVGLEPGIGG
jgi:hypothetical protein